MCHCILTSYQRTLEFCILHSNWRTHHREQSNKNVEIFVPFFSKSTSSWWIHEILFQIANQKGIYIYVSLWQNWVRKSRDSITLRADTKLQNVTFWLVNALVETSVSCPMLYRILLRPAHCGVWLCYLLCNTYRVWLSNVLPTVESDSAISYALHVESDSEMSCPPWSLTLLSPMHYM